MVNQKDDFNKDYTKKTETTDAEASGATVVIRRAEVENKKLLFYKFMNELGIQEKKTEGGHTCFIQNHLWNYVNNEFIKKAKAEQKGVCVWREDESGNWWCDCKNAFCLNAGTPTENEFKFCCYCGKPLEECRFEEE